MPEEQRSPLPSEQRRDEDIMTDPDEPDAKHSHRRAVKDEGDDGSPLRPEPAAGEDVLRPDGGSAPERTA